MLASTVLALGLSASSYSAEVQEAILEATAQWHFEMAEHSCTSYSAEVQDAILEATQVWE